MSYLDQYLDTGLEIDPDFDLQTESEKIWDRLAFEAAYSKLCHHHKRRLGPDATPRELARDKAYSKRNMHGCISLLMAHGLSQKEIAERIAVYSTDSEAKTIAAQIDWLQQLTGKIQAIRNHQRKIATHCIKNGTIKEGNRLVQRLENELNSMEDRYKRVFPPENTAKTAKEVPE